MGLFNHLFGHDPEKEDRENLEANEYYQNYLNSADKRKDEMGEHYGDTNSLEDMEGVEEDNKWWQWGVRRN